MQPRESLYELLRVDSNASAAEIRRAFLKLAYEHHPDIACEETVGDANFKKIRAAYEILIDPQSRSLYDLDPELIYQRFRPASPIVTESVRTYEPHEFRTVWLKDARPNSSSAFFWSCACLAAIVLVSAAWFSQQADQSTYRAISSQRLTEQPTKRIEPRVPSEVQETSGPLQELNVGVLASSPDSPEDSSVLSDLEPGKSRMTASNESTKPSGAPDWYHSPFESLTNDLPMYPENISASPGSASASPRRSSWVEQRRRFGSDMEEPVMSMTPGPTSSPIMHRPGYTAQFGGEPYRGHNSQEPAWRSPVTRLYGSTPSQAELVNRGVAGPNGSASQSWMGSLRINDRYRSASPSIGYGGTRNSGGIAPLTRRALGAPILGPSRHPSFGGPRRMLSH